MSDSVRRSRREDYFVSHWPPPREARDWDATAAIEFVHRFVQGRKQRGFFVFGHSHFILRA